MAFPFTHRGKLQFALRGDPDAVVEQYYEGASYKLERALAIDAAVEVSASDNKLTVSYTINFKTLLVTVSVFVLTAFGIYFAIWDILIPPDWPRTWAQNKEVPAGSPTITHMITVTCFAWMWFFGSVYVMIIARLRSLLRDTWKELRLP